jgi:hypothetical protein
MEEKGELKRMLSVVVVVVVVAVVVVHCKNDLTF